MEKLTINERIKSFATLGERVREWLETNEAGERSAIFNELYFNAYNQNTWFTTESVENALKGILNFLNEETLRNWLTTYKIKDNSEPKVVGTIMAGNIPMVGFHDLMCVLLSGNKLKMKLSVNDTYLMKYVTATLCEIEPKWNNYIELAEKLKDIDALIATGSDNTARHFDYYFKHVPRIIRRNRTACAILQGNETEEELQALAMDVFTYFGLGCRNVTKLYVPQYYSFEQLLKVFEPYGKQAITNHKYANNYDYNKSILLVNGVEHLDNGYLLLKEDVSLFSALSTLHYERYSDLDELKDLLDVQKHKIQCIVDKKGSHSNSVLFGYAQSPSINDYADGVDTMAFLISLN